MDIELLSHRAKHNGFLTPIAVTQWQETNQHWFHRVPECWQKLYYQRTAIQEGLQGCADRWRNEGTGVKLIECGFVKLPNGSVSRGNNASFIFTLAQVWQYVTLMRRIFLIDCPGVVYPTGETETEKILKGVVSTFQKLEQMIWHGQKWRPSKNLGFRQWHFLRSCVINRIAFPLWRVVVYPNLYPNPGSRGVRQESRRFNRDSLGKSKTGVHQENVQSGGVERRWRFPGADGAQVRQITEGKDRKQLISVIRYVQGVSFVWLMFILPFHFGQKFVCNSNLTWGSSHTHCERQSAIWSADWCGCTNEFLFSFQKGEPDICTVAKMILNDWQRGKIPFFVKPPGADVSTVRFLNWCSQPALGCSKMRSNQREIAWEHEFLSCCWPVISGHAHNDFWILCEIFFLCGFQC